MSELDNRNINEMYKAFESADSIIMKKYLHKMDELPLVKISEPIEKLKAGSNFQLFKIEKIVYDKDENTLDKLTTVYSSLSSYVDSAVILMLIGDRDHVDIYMGSACRKLDGTYKQINEGSNSDKINIIEKIKCDEQLRGKQKTTLETSFVSNFIGSDIVSGITVEKPKNDNQSKKNNEYIIEQLFANKSAVSAVSGVPAIRNENAEQNKSYIQGIEKFIESMKGTEYSVLFIADVVSKERIDFICAQYEDLYSQLYPFAKSEQTLNTSKQIGEINTLIKGITDTTNKSVSNATSTGTTVGTFSSHTVGGSISATVGGSVGADVGARPFGFGGGVSANISASVTASADYHYTKGKSESETKTQTETETTGTAKSLTEQNSLAKSLSTTTGESVQISYFNRAVKSLLDRIDAQIERLKTFEDVGVFDCGTYFLSDKASNTISAATKYKAIVRGENSSIEGSAINTWEDDDAKIVFEYLKKMYHPLIAVKQQEADSVYTTPTSMLSGKELAIQLSLPKKSVAGVPVIDCAEFGRDVLSYEVSHGENLHIGEIYHMHHIEKESKVKLSKDSLSSHVFITGSTGAGKSNTLFQILSEAIKADPITKEKVHFLVIEPAKGEYKSVFGGRKDVNVYGTNPLITNLLRIDPSSFPDDILVSEHIDRLVEIFNVCWPMYAAMPAILKDAVIRAYEECGWNIDLSENKYNLFPTFIDVLNQVRAVLNESEYSSDNKGDYTGALVTRIKSLTNGINGMIFSGDSLTDSQLFDENVIIDLGRVGSTETKSLIMGLLVLKLQEYRISQGEPDNTKLKHLTVIEEAHNLLKRTSLEQTSESSNLLGKSVEMLANSIAELRSFGEGFIIADQSPGLLDMSVIRNTNTKIIHRLPDFSDRELVGKAASLNEEQIVELARLPLGVAAIYQNNWINPVLCKVLPFKNKKMLRNEKRKIESTCNREHIKTIFDLIIKPNEYIKYNEEQMMHSTLSGRTKRLVQEYLDLSNEHTMDRQASLIYSAVCDLNSAQKTLNKRSLKDLERNLLLVVGPYIDNYTEQETQNLIALYLKGAVIIENTSPDMYCEYIERLKEV